MFNFKKKAVVTALLMSVIGTQAYAEGSTNPSLDRFNARLDAIEAKYPQAKGIPVPEIGRNMSNVEAKKVEVKTSTKEEDQTVAKKADAKTTTSPADGEVPGISKIVNLGITSMRAVASEDGTILYIADTGRFVFTGRMLDVWQQKELKTIDEIERATQRVYLDSMGYDKTSYSSYKLGTGSKRTVIFVDPHCGWCHQLISEAKADPELMKEYTFVFHVIPILGADSQTYAKKLWCSVATDEEKLQAMLDGDEAVNALPASAQCDMDMQDRTVYLSKIIRVSGVPFVIAPDGRVSQGKPADLKAFLRGEEKSRQEPKAKP